MLFFCPPLWWLPCYVPSPATETATGEPIQARAYLTDHDDDAALALGVVPCPSAPLAFCPSWGFCFCRPFVAITPSTIYLHSFLIIFVCLRIRVLGSLEFAAWSWDLAKSRAAARLIVWLRWPTLEAGCCMLIEWRELPANFAFSQIPLSGTFPVRTPPPPSTSAPFASRAASLRPACVGCGSSEFLRHRRNIFSCWRSSLASANHSYINWINNPHT